MKALIILGASDLKKEVIGRYLDNDSILIGTDSGCNILYSYSIVPDYILGDFDSIDNKVLSYYENLQVKKTSLKKDKNFTDGEAAILLAKKLGFKKIYLASPLKTEETDQLLGNILLLAKYKGVVLFNNKEIIRFLEDDELKITKNEGRVFSIVPLNKSLVKIKGSLFDGEFKVSLGDTFTLRNEIKENKAIIQIKEGKALIIQSIL